MLKLYKQVSALSFYKYIYVHILIHMYINGTYVHVTLRRPRADIARYSLMSKNLYDVWTLR